MLRVVLSSAICLIVTSSLTGKSYYVSPSGEDTADGSRPRPIRSIAVAASRVSAGDTIILRGGRYAEPVTLDGLRGTRDRPITITSCQTVVFDGTDPLCGQWSLVTAESPEGKPIQKAQWKRIGGHRLYAIHLEKDIYALIYDDRLMCDARWPNARWDDPWPLDRYMVLRRASERSEPGRIYDGLPTEKTLEESAIFQKEHTRWYSLLPYGSAGTGHSTGMVLPQVK